MNAQRIIWLNVALGITLVTLIAGTAYKNLVSVDPNPVLTETLQEELARDWDVFVPSLSNEELTLPPLESNPTGESSPSGLQSRATESRPYYGYYDDDHSDFDDDDDDEDDDFDDDRDDDDDDD